MTDLKSRKSVRKLTLSPRVRQTLRSSKHVLATVSSLRASASLKEFAGIAEWLNRFSVLDSKFQLSRRPKTIEALRTQRILLADAPFAVELAWAKAYLSQQGDLLRAFSERRLAYTRKLLQLTPTQALKALDEFDIEYGTSLWSIEQRLCFIQLAEGLEAQKRYAQTISDGTSNLTVRFLTTLWSIRNERATYYETYRRELKDRLPEWTQSQEFSDYALFRCVDDVELTRKAFASILQWEFPSPIIDFYEIFVRLARRAVCAQHEMSLEFGKSAKELLEIIGDQRLHKIAFYADPNLTLSTLESPECTISDAWLSGKTVSPSADSEVAGYANIAALSRSSLPFTRSGDTLGERIISDLRILESKTTGFERLHADTVNFLINLSALDIRAAILSKINDSIAPSDSPGNVQQIEAFWAAPGIEPAILRFLPALHQQTISQYLRKNCFSPTVEAESIRAGTTMLPPKSGITSAIVQELHAIALYDAGSYEELLPIAADNDPKPEPRSRNLARLRANALLGLGLIPEAVREIVQTVLADAAAAVMLPIKHCYAAISEDTNVIMEADLALVLLVELYSRQAPEALTNLRYRYEDFLGSQQLNKPSQLRSRYEHLPFQQLVYFLRYVCTQRVMQLCVEFPTSRSVRDERLAVCALLRDLDPKESSVYDAEIIDITKQQEITRGIQEVEQSKIWIDQQSIRRWAENNLKESFARLMDLHVAGFRSDISASGTGITEAEAETVIRASEVPELPKNEASDLLLRLVGQFLTHCFLNKPHGLDSYLSIRVRHGVFAGQMRAAPEAEKIVTLQRDTGTLDYFPAQYWITNFDRTAPDVALKVDQRLRHFSREYDLLIDSFVKEQLQIRREGHVSGLFRLGYVPTDILLLQADLHRETTFNTFIDRCLQIFWNSVDSSLIELREYIDNVLQVRVNSLFVELISDLEAITRAAPSAELSHAVRHAHTKTSNALEQVKAWFQPARPRSSLTTSFQHLVEISLQVVKNMDPAFNPTLEADLLDFPLVVQLQRLTDVFVNLFDNVRKHCGIKSNVKIQVRAHSFGSYFELEVVNEVGSGVANNVNRAKLEAIRERIEQGTHLRAVTSQGGTGLLKIRSMLLSDSADANSFEFGFKGNDQFVVRLKVPSVVVAIGGGNEATITS